MRQSIIDLHQDWKKPDRTDDDTDSFLARLERLVNISVTCDSIYGDGVFNQLTLNLKQLYKEIDDESIKEASTFISGC